MAGIGFELKKLFKEKGIILNLRASFYASAVIAGPMILGAVLLFGIKYLAFSAGASVAEQDTVVVLVTYSLMGPLILTNCITLVLTRYVADQMYDENKERILPSMYGGISLCLLIGAPLWIAFLSLSKIPLLYQFFSFMLFCESIVVWIQVSYINAAKDYRSALLGFGLGILLGFLSAAAFIWGLHLDIVKSLLVAVCLSYGVMIISSTIVLHGYFPVGRGSSLFFLQWVEKHPRLIFIGFFMSAGLFFHNLIMWVSPWSRSVVGIFRTAPGYDIPSFLALMTTLYTTVRFVTAVEMAFYPKYRIYFGLLNGGSSLDDLQRAKEEMITVMKQELFYLAQIQMLIELVLIAVAGTVLPRLQMGFTPDMVGLFRVLCVGYGLYAIGYSMVLFLLYLSNYGDAMISTFTLVVISGLGTVVSLYFPSYYYGFGFVAGTLFLLLQAWIRLSRYVNHLDYNIFCRQPIFVRKQDGLLSRLAHQLDRRHS